jgi:hypothetical protein
MELRRHIGGDFHPSGALSISTVPRAETALVVVFDPRGPRRAYIDYFRLNPKPFGRKHQTSAGLDATSTTQIFSVLRTKFFLNESNSGR